MSKAEMSRRFHPVSVLAKCPHTPELASGRRSSLTGPNRARPGLDQALAAVRSGDTLVVPKLDRLARSVPDARDIGDALVARGVKLALGGSIYDPSDPMSKMFFNMLAVFAEFEVDLLRMRTREGRVLDRTRSSEQ
ncbi:recombinase family protein [Nonomuraea sp. NPDC059194]|uniref:recombinase family protein n=1 Tax=Nonomuraea sp. NPDC059194 TaxID=3346764 RepID=UPI0036B6F4E8